MIRVDSVFVEEPLPNSAYYSLEDDEIPYTVVHRPHCRDLLTNETRSMSPDIPIPTKFVQQFRLKKQYQATQLFGVVCPIVLKICGSLLLLDIDQYLGKVGLQSGIFLVVLSFALVLVSVLSISTIFSNGFHQEKSSGGVYFLLSRSVGPEIGGAAGVLWFFGNCLGSSVQSSAFGSIISEMFEGEYNIMLANVLATFLVNLAVLLVFYFGYQQFVRLQFVLLLFVLFCLTNIFIGCFQTVDIKSFESNSDSIFDSLGLENLLEGLASIFPAICGIMAGVNSSTSIKNASRNVGLGTLKGLLITFFVFCFFLVVLSISTPKALLISERIIFLKSVLPANVIIFGLAGSTLGTVGSFYSGAQRILYSLVDDELMPFFSVLSKKKQELKKKKIVNKDSLASTKPKENAGTNKLPLFVTWSLILFLSAFDLSKTKSIITNCFLFLYSILNISVFLADNAESTSWRPTFKYYNKYVSLIGGLLCFLMMMIIDPFSTFGFLIIVVILIIYINHHIKSKGMMAKYGDFLQTNLTGLIVQQLYDLDELMHSKQISYYYRPHPLILIDDIDEQIQFLKASLSMFGRRGYNLVSRIIVCDRKFSMKIADLSFLRREMSLRLKRFGLKAASEVVFDTTYRSGVQALLCSAGISSLRPNIVVLPILHYRDEKSIIEWVNCLRDIFAADLSVVIVSAPEVIVPCKKKPCENVDPFNQYDRNSLDCYFLIDDGGLSLLLSHFLAKKWNLTFNINISSHHETVDEDTVFLEKVLGEFRLEAQILYFNIEPILGTESLNTFQTETKAKRDSLFELFPELINQYKIIPQKVEVYPNMFSSVPPETLEDWCNCSDAYLANLFHASFKFEIPAQHMNQTTRIMRLNFSIRLHSLHGKVVTITFPLPKVNICEKLFVAWLDILCFIPGSTVYLIRGNGESVVSTHT
eukprot:TRINITY_DN1898_c0_g1_i1.p1 TRINITY_DN1898_c0_g1~~TRINITY_DN1898_c0_g1_i1.p1  ORF type:complete len:938 (+),score=217.73 TRINITY_DN1898_c0_g1_i1:36-2816(+)